MSQNVAVTVKILDKDFTIGCPPDEKANLLESAKYLNEQMEKVRDAGVIGTDKIAIMASLNITRDFLKDKTIAHNYDALSSGLNTLLDQLDTKLSDIKQPS